MIQETSGPAHSHRDSIKTLADNRWFMSFMSWLCQHGKKRHSSNYISYFVLWYAYYLILSYHVISSLISKSERSWMLLAQSLKLWGLWDTINAWVIKKSGIFIACRHSQLSERNGHGNTIRGSIMKDQSPIQPNWNIHWNFYRACAWMCLVCLSGFWEGDRRSSPGSVWCHRELWESVLRVWWTDSQVCSNERSNCYEQRIGNDR